MTTAHTTSQPSQSDAFDHTRQALLAVQGAIAALLAALEALGDTGALGYTPGDAQEGSGLLAPLVSDPRIAGFYRARLDTMATKLAARYPNTPITERTIGQLMRYWPKGTIETTVPNEHDEWVTIEREWTWPEQRAWAIKALLRDGRLTKQMGEDKAGRVQTYYIPQPPPQPITPEWS